MADSRLTDFLEKRTEVLDREWTESTCLYRVSIGQRQVEQLLARGSRFTIDGEPAARALRRLWPTPPPSESTSIPPHRRHWPDDQGT